MSKVAIATASSDRHLSTPLGQIVLVNLGEGVSRPLIVVEDVGGVLNGWLFCDSHVDSASLWLRQASGGQPTKYSGPLYLSDLVEGPGVGQWRIS